MSAASVAGVLGELGREVGEVDVAVVVAGDHDHAACRPSPRDAALVPWARRRDEAHVALGVAAAAVVGADGEQPGQLALASRRWAAATRRRSR